MERRKVLVTGATGFIGQYVIRNLLKKPGVEIFAVTRDIQKASLLDFFPKIKFVESDIALGSSRILHIVSGVDAVIHLAWDGLPNYKESFHIEKNLFDNYRFCKEAIEYGVKNLTVVGTCFEYGMVDGCLKEDMYPKPNNAYALAKDSLRKFIEQLSSKHSFLFKWVRLFYMYGVGQAKTSLVSQLEQAILRGDIEFNMSGGEQLRDYLPVADVAANIIACSLQEQVNGIINCSSGKPVSVRNFVENYLKERNVAMKLNFGYYPYPDYEPMAFWGDNRKLKMILSNKEN
ncbi:MAG: NAD-dependent epimerase/dehydratase family protein [Leptospiraceae bacterium]|nr:NAD-dependent epimerase/dehydratase family protein [Leptospiraceae bacterium]MBP9889154.1 NAD-dependent epimerase/dehydratase family protein [Leptospiraceae bacterium]